MPRTSWAAAFPVEKVQLREGETTVNGQSVIQNSNVRPLLSPALRIYSRIGGGGGPRESARAMARMRTRSPVPKGVPTLKNITLWSVCGLIVVVFCILGAERLQIYMKFNSV